jgi:hypothetical protein
MMPVVVYPQRKKLQNKSWNTGHCSSSPTSVVMSLGCDCAFAALLASDGRSSNLHRTYSTISLPRRHR